MKDIKNIFDEAPDSRLWDRLEDRLDRKQSIKKLKFYRISAVAAMGAAVIFAVTYFNHILDDHNPHLFASNGDFSSFVLEEIAHDEEGLFNMELFGDMRAAYSKRQVDEVDLSGEYVAINGEISFSISMKDYTYALDFAFDGLPEMTLVRASGQTLYFESDNGQKMKMNIEPYGLELLSSEFLPEYKSYKFKKITSI